MYWRKNLPETPIFVAGKISFPEMLPSISHLYLDRAATKMQLSRNIMTPPFPGRVLAVWGRKVVVAEEITPADDKVGLWPIHGVLMVF